MTKRSADNDATDSLWLRSSGADAEDLSEAQAGGGPGGADNCEQLFLDQLNTIRSIVRFIGRRRRLATHELEEFASHVNLKLIEEGYAVLRKFEGRSSLRRYLSVVIGRLFLDWRMAQWGKWRPSSFAKRNGRVALLLERLTVCQGLSFDEARTTLETVHRLDIGSSELESLYARLPRRPRRRYSGDDALHDFPASYGDPTSGLIAEAEESTATEMSRALSAELATLAPEDLRLLKLKFLSGLSVAAIARTTSEDSKRLYRRLERLLARLCARLQERGIHRSDVFNLLGRADLKLTGAWALRHEASCECAVADSEVEFVSVPALVAAANSLPTIERSPSSLI
jgi:RNA polymerase sigma factor (sigma-70 family)